MNLIEDRWIPVRRQNGKEERIAPWELTDNFETNPIVALAAPRPDFKGGLMQFLIGLLQTAAPPDEAQGLEWEDWLEEPPGPEILKKAFAPYIHCFDLDGDGPRFMQDLEMEGGKEKGINYLLIDAPGENTLENNADHFVKRGSVRGMCYSCAGMALFTLQTNAPGGGSGHFTSLRGGGPLTSLIVLDPLGSGLQTNTLWHNLWLNILDRRTNGSATDLSKKEWESIFPWLGATRTSEPKTGRATYPKDVHRLQMYWGMPRRIRLDLIQVSQGICDICAESVHVLITKLVTKTYGINYEGSWQHPLSPYEKSKKGNSKPLRLKSGVLTYNYWFTLFEGTKGQTSQTPAQVVTEFKKRSIYTQEQFRLWIFGYDMDPRRLMTPRNWYETTFPLYLFGDEDQRKKFAIRVQEKIEASTMVADFVHKRVKEAWFRRPGDIKGDTEFIKEAFFASTEGKFFNSLQKLYEVIKEEEDGLNVLADWYDILRRSAKSLFEDYVAREDTAFANMKRIVEARKKLLRDINSNKLRLKLHIPKKRKEKAV